MGCSPPSLVLLRLLVVFLAISRAYSFPAAGTNGTAGSLSIRELKTFSGSLEPSGVEAPRYCDHEGYFHPRNWKASEAGPRYMEWTMLLDKQSEAWTNRLSEPNFFARDILEWTDLDCGISYSGCIRMPSCDYILTKLQNMEKARQVYFILLSMHNINLISGVVNAQSLPAQVNVASMTPNMAQTFFWKHSDALAKKCKREMDVIKGILSGLVTVTLIASPLLTEGVVLGEAAIEARIAAKLAEEVAEKTVIQAERVVLREGAAITRGATRIAEAEERSARALGRIATAEGAAGRAISAGERAAAQAEITAARATVAEVKLLKQQSKVLMKEAQEAAKSASSKAVLARTESANALAKAVDKKVKDSHLVEAPRWSLVGITRKGAKTWSRLTSGLNSAPLFAFASFPMTVAGGDPESKYCALFPNPSEEAEHIHQLDLDKNIERAGVGFRREIQSDMGDINKGVGFEEGGHFSLLGNSVLSDQIFDGTYVQLSAADHLRFVEEPFLIEKDITAHFKNAVISQCLKEELCYLHCTKTPAGFSESRSRFEPVPGTMCQVQCWRNWRIGQTVEMYGIDDLIKPHNDWDIELRQFIGESFRHWQEYRYDPREGNYFPSVGDLFAGKLTSSSGSNLPVCYSELIVPHSLKNKNEKRDLPCICGDWMGNETAVFFREAGFDKWSANLNRKGLAKECQQTMRHLKSPPVQTFLSLCHNEWHWPMHNDGHRDIQKGRDDLCDDVEGEVEALRRLSWDNRRVNCHICFTSPVGRAISHNQKSWYKSSPNGKDYYTFAAACHEFDANPATACLY